MRSKIYLCLVLGLLLFLAGGVSPDSVRAAAPAPPTNLIAEGDHYSYINLRWTDNSENEAQFIIFRYKEGEAGFTPIANVPANTWRYKDTGLDPDTTYRYKIRARNNDGYSIYSNQATAETSNHPKLRILSPNGGEVWTEGETHYITWTCDGEEMVGFIEYSVNGGPHVRLATAMDMDPGTYGWTIPNLDSDQVKILVAAYPHDSGATGSDWTDGYITIRPLIHAVPFGPPAAPSGLSLTGMETVTLHWTDNSVNETGFKIERREGHGVFGQIATVGADVTTYEDPGLTRGITYTYRVRAYNSSGDSAYSNEVQRSTMLSLDPALPSAPSHLSVNAEGSTSIELSWEDESDNETGFKIERKRGTGSFDQVETVAENVTSYTNTGLSPDTTYTYRVRAYNSTGDSAYSNVDSASTTAAEEPSDTTSPTRKTVLTFHLDSGEYHIKGPGDSEAWLVPMDTAPVIQEGRTMVPIRYVVEPIGATVGWDGATRRVTITLGPKKIDLWIDNSTASVGGVNTIIDPANPAVAPFIQPPGRTMLPLRFIAENLGCTVEWNPDLREVTVTYPAG